MEHYSVRIAGDDYFGRVADDPGFSFPIYHDLLEFNAADIWRPEAEIKAARSQ